MLNQIDPLKYHKIRYKKLHPDAKIIQPRIGDAGYDLCSLEKYRLWSMIDDDMRGTCDNSIKVNTGIAIEIPKGYVGLIRDRSSFGAKGIIVCGGVIDSSYRGELIVCLRNVSENNYTINKGDKVAQLVIVLCNTPTLVEVNELDETERGDNGFGSTGV